MTNSKVADSLKLVLADTSMLYLKTHNFHWNVTGPNFKSLHLMFEEQYNELFLAIDLIAERIRALGAKAPGTYAAYSKVTKIKEGDENLAANLMVKELVKDQETIVKTLTNTLKAAQAAGDEVTASMVGDRIEIHQKNAWMLRSSL